MIITNIKRHEDDYSIFIVTLTPNWIEKIFGVKEKNKEFRDSGKEYLFGNQTVYIDKNGYKTSNGSTIAKAIDRFKSKW